MTKTGQKASRPPEAAEKGGVSRRQFLAGVGGLGVGALLGGSLAALALPDSVYAVPASQGYLLVDTKKCGGCESCMLTCSLVHTGKENLALSRIQVAKSALAGFPQDSAQYQCRQCPYPECVEACPTGAMHADEATGVRTVDEGKCIGCQRCISACPFTPSRVQWNFEERHAQKCDLCKNTPYWNREGGPGGTQACVAVCPMKAISFTAELPVQSDEGYEENMRNIHWSNLSFPIDDAGKVSAETYMRAKAAKPAGEDASTDSGKMA
ncbi:4Fe-4S dicluster domain-containing protein [Gordonibacter massiliensis (ex Traore et al. 2017)]|uniref:4Fe-4S dicluster domain-containing protein n=1 Tax=Gordonibacter massiliensis (ex Traore et al. 2017) TaxID=1841863 RepID=UPI001C8CC42D|nr:4Fe-4S dicluster domain-containing protein [Gordonibacter massiliensis (ex Traore et al. 2017)]MBX9034959.1 4Fe-4S dicluster domain-containing protein [Gordonibacter massiliensis (ex Traore et al. 2017)]